ncbi:MAG: NIPSNAP family protein [Phenylobacterium sp.]
MIVEMRIYTLKSGKAGEFFAAYQADGLAVHTKHLGALLGYYTTEIGPLNTLVHLWGYDSHADREARRAALYSDPAWVAFGAKVSDLFSKLESRILQPAPFFQDGLRSAIDSARAARAALAVESL